MATRILEQVEMPLVMRHAPHNGTRTSRDAALEIRRSLNRLEQAVLVYVAGRADGATAQEIGAALSLSGDTVRPRLVELRERALVRDSGRTRKTLAGRLAVVWERA